MKLLPLPQRSRRLLLAVLAVALSPALDPPHSLLAADAGRSAPSLELKHGDHISFIGNTLADRMQHDGWLETLLQNRFPKHELVIRNLGFSGDELTIRLRSANFGSLDDWLGAGQTDVIFAFFGYNESFGGREGLDKFKKDLESFITTTLAKKYNGTSAPRLVLFSPIAHENLHDRNLSDGKENNERLALYTDAMRDAAVAAGVVFVDLFHPSRELYKKASKPLTINGIHLTDEGNRQIAAVIDGALFPGSPAPQREAQTLERLRAAVLEKNFYWFNRYRTVDGFSIYGGRADLTFVGGQTNRVVMQREMEVLDVMTANRDKRVWAAARGGDLKVDDSNTPPFIPVQTNKPGAGPNGAHIFLSGEEAITKMRLAKGIKVNLFASEKEFPDLEKPVQMAFDTKGRLWVAVWPTYPHWKPKEEMNDKLLIFEDTDGDGRADKRIVFADKLHCPTGFEFYNGGVLVAQAPDLMFLKDTDGDDRADVRTRVLNGLDSADTHHTSNSFSLDPGGALYFQEGTFHHTQVETPYGPAERSANAAVFRYEPRAQKFDVYVPYGFANPHGHAFDHWGQDFVYDGTGANPYHGTLFSGHLDFPNKHNRPPQVYKQRTRPCPGVEFLSSRHFPESFRGILLVANVIGDQGILQYRIDDNDASFEGTELEPLLMSSDPNFRPSDIEVAPDGSVYFLDWQNPIIGHMQHNLRDPSRDRKHGRIYRITYEGRALLEPPKIAGEPIEKLLALLKEPEDRTRYRAKIELGARDTQQVLAAVDKWVAGLDKSDPDYEHQVLEALWVYQYHNVVNADLLKRVLQSRDFRARAAATRVLCYWRDRVPDALELLKKLAADSYPRVRLEAVRAASFFTVAEAIEVPLISADAATDEYLDYTRGETMRALEPHWKKALAAGRSIAFTSPAGARFFLKGVSTDQLLKMKRDQAVDLELIFRSGLRDEVRSAALADLAKHEKKDSLHVLIDAINTQDGQKGDTDASVVFDLVRLLTGRPAAELASVRGDLEKMATSARLPVTRQLGYVALIAADRSVDRAWALGTRTPRALVDVVSAMPLIRDPNLRAELYPKVEPLLHGLPASLAGSPAAKGVRGRFVRIELPGRQRTLTLAEVEVTSGGRNVAPRGKASQKNTGYGGEARRAIDGNKNPSYGAGGQTHTVEGTENPWWELDLGAEYPIEEIAVYNRNDGELGSRLKGFTLKVLDGGRQTVFQKTRIPAPEPTESYAIGGSGSLDIVRRAAMSALTYVRGQEVPTFKALAGFVRKGVDRDAAVQALLRIPTKEWPAEEAQPLLESVLSYVRALPAQDRTSPPALDALQLGNALASLLPRDQARQARRDLGELGVRVLRLGTLPEQMLFDKDRLVVQASKPVQVIFENNDMMPHNFVVTQPGALEEVGLLGESTATDPGAIDRGYVPRSPKILVSSRLIQPRDVQKLDFNAPSRPGVYPYVCTYPGHWRRMYGALHVVEDLEQYLSDPEGYLASHPAPIADTLLKYTGPRKEWKYDELAPVVEQMAHEGGRSFANGKQLFQVANCVACHKLNGAGNAIGPDLAKLDPKQTVLDILRSVAEPSAKIDEKYASYLFDTKAGKVVTGMVLEENAKQVKVIENPLAKSQPVVLEKSEIIERQKSQASIMPKGLLDKLSREEVLDLIGYITARGDEKNKVFQGGHEHHAGH